MTIWRFSVVLAGALMAASASLAADEAHTIVQMSRAFHPGEITILRGETLVFSNRDDFIHQIYVKSDSMNFDSDEQPPGQNVSVSFSVAGTFAVRCRIHPRMNLSVHVK